MACMKSQGSLNVRNAFAFVVVQKYLDRLPRTTRGDSTSACCVDLDALHVGLIREHCKRSVCEGIAERISPCTYNVMKSVDWHARRVAIRR